MWYELLSYVTLNSLLVPFQRDRVGPRREAKDGKLERETVSMQPTLKEKNFFQGKNCNQFIGIC